jgi:DnaJ-class molecular chaperone
MANISLRPPMQDDDAIETLASAIQELPLDQVCDNCNGDGGRKGGDRDWTPCRRCNGTGYMLTELGEKIIEFVRRH